MSDLKSNKMGLKINIGCGGRPLEGFINVDMDSLEDLQARYPNSIFPEGIKIYNWDIFNLPIEDNSVSELLCEAMIEHLSFEEEPKFFFEVKRVLKPGGKFIFSTTNFEEIAKLWLDAEDDWKDFYKNDEKSIQEQHWFGTNTYEPKNRWGYLTASFYGSQNGVGQFHTNCYTEKKLSAICNRLGFEVVSIDKFQWKGDRDHMLELKAIKK
mgnify:CR=1 FL=1